MRNPIARRYHDATAHSPHSVRTDGHTLDWDVKPSPFKVYAELAPLALPRDIDAVTADTLAALGDPPPPRASAVTLAGLAGVLYYAAGVTKKKTYPGGGEMFFRAAASTGALYQTEVYVAVGEVAGLAPGLYHFCPGDFALRRLRDGDVRAPLAVAAADPSVRHRAATVVLTAIFWRNTWKYRARGYRHLFWDSGTMLANLLAVADRLGLAPRVLTGFVDADVNRLLGLDASREAALELVPLGPEGAAAPDTPDLTAVDHAVVPLSPSEVDYPLLREVHAASALDTPEAVRAWRAGGSGFAGRADPAAAPSGGALALPAARAASGRGLDETIARRASTRRFGPSPLDAVELSTALWAATREVPADIPGGLVDLYVIVTAVAGVPPGAYVYRPADHALELLRAGEFRGESAYLCLEQPLGGDAAAIVYFMADLDTILAALGDRGYRAANLLAGIAGGRAYLAAYGLGFGATGLTFYDGQVIDFFSPRAAHEDAIFVVALGRSAGAGHATIGPTVISPRRPPA